jgi:hypothetical protein
VGTEESEEGAISMGQLLPILENLNEPGEELQVPLNGRRYKI